MLLSCDLSFNCIFIYDYYAIAFDIVSLNVACGVCHSDLHLMKGDFLYTRPCVVGHEITGEVVEHGPLTDTRIVKRFSSINTVKVLLILYNVL